MTQKRDLVFVFKFLEFCIVLFPFFVLGWYLERIEGAVVAVNRLFKSYIQAMVSMSNFRELQSKIYHRYTKIAG